MKIVFLDRDGVINRYPGDGDFVKKWDEFRFLPRAKSALKKLSEKKYKIIVISNQSGVSKGIYPKENLELITKNMLSALNKNKINLGGVYYCIHREEDNCSCRKPKTGLIDATVKNLEKQSLRIDLAKSYFIGDTIRDMQAGKAAGLKTILVFSGKEKENNKKNWGIRPDYTAKDLYAAVKLII